MAVIFCLRVCSYRYIVIFLDFDNLQKPNQNRYRILNLTVRQIVIFQTINNGNDENVRPTDSNFKKQPLTEV